MTNPERIFSEDDVKRAVAAWLESDGWDVVVAWGAERGVDIAASREGLRWIIEAKGTGLHSQARANYFLQILGTLLQRMNNDNDRYSVALPDLSQYRRLWERLPNIVKLKLGITALFVGATGEVTRG